MKNLKDCVKAVKNKEPIDIKAAGDPGNGKTPEEIEKEILENREAMEAIAAKESEAKTAKEPVEKEAAKSELEIFTTKPIQELKKAVIRTCPFCEEEKSAQGMNRHIAAKHKVPGVTVQDLDDVEKGLKSLKDLTCEKFPSEDEAEVYNLAPEVEKKHFSDWVDVDPEEEGPEDPEEGLEEEDPEQIPEDDRENPDNPGPPGDPSCYDNSGNLKLKENPKSEYEWTCPDAPFPLNLLRRKKERKQ